MTYKIGLPRALLYHTYFPLWQTFFAELGAETVISEETNKSILDQGLKCVVDETCLPVKVFFGHAAHLSEKDVHFLFVPRMVSVEKKAYICPKLMGLPDMLSASKIQHPPLIQPVMNMVKSANLDDFLWTCASPFSGSWRKIKKAWKAAEQEQKRYEENLIGKYQDDGNDLTVLVLGHDYNLYDKYLNLGIMEKLRKLACTVVTTAQISRAERDRQLGKFPRSIFWTYGRNLIGSVYNFTQYPGKKGVIILTSFGCGIDSFIGNLITRRLAEYQIPYLNIILDEHSGEAGLVTRIEAFVDIIRWRRACHENYISSYGQYVDSAERNVGIYRDGGSRTPNYH